MTRDAYDSVLAALCLWREARGEPLTAKRAVMHVLWTRARDPRWPSSLAGVILQPHQFSSFSAGDPNATKFPAPADAAWLDCCAAVDDPGDDPTSGANHYHSYVPGDPHWPAWATPDRLTATIGAFRFYRL